MVCPRRGRRIRLTPPRVRPREAPGGRRYQAGDRVLALTPGPGGAWVTSERAILTAVHRDDGSVDAVAGDGRHLHLSGEQTGADRLTHAFAVTVHRSQGSTSDTAHVLEYGGGRELAFAAMSRAPACQPRVRPRLQRGRGCAASAVGVDIGTARALGRTTKDNPSPAGPSSKPTGNA
jgi:hypothetical protein